MIVLDASGAVIGLLSGGESRAVLRDEAIVCPHLVDSEVAHALRSQTFRGAIDFADAQRALNVWQRLGVERVGVTGLLDRIWGLRENATACAASYVAVAESLGVPLVTADARLAGLPGLRCTVTVVRR